MREKNKQFTRKKALALVLLIAALSYVLTATLSALLDVCGALVTVVKIVVESALFILSYRLQKKWVFG